MTATRMLPGLHPALVLCLALGVGGAACAADDKKLVKANQERIQRLQQAQQVLMQEKSQLSADKADIERQLHSTKAELERVRVVARREAAAQSGLMAVRAEKETLASRLAELERQLAESRQKLQISAEADAQARKTLLLTQRELDQRKKELAGCETQNLGLYKLNTDLLSRYEKAAGAGSWLSGGIFTQFDRVRVETESATYLDRIEDLKVQPRGTPQ